MYTLLFALATANIASYWNEQCPIVVGATQCELILLRIAELPGKHGSSEAYAMPDEPEGIGWRVTLDKDTLNSAKWQETILHELCHIAVYPEDNAHGNAWYDCARKHGVRNAHRYRFR